MQRNIAELRAMLLNDTFADMCPTLTDDERTALTVRYSIDMQSYILAVDELRNSYVIPFILRVQKHSLLDRITGTASCSDRCGLFLHMSLPSVVCVSVCW